MTFIGGGVAEAFTKAFVQVEALDIQSQLNMCMSCMCTVDGPVCDNTNFSYCMSLSGMSRSFRYVKKLARCTE